MLDSKEFGFNVGPSYLGYNLRFADSIVTYDYTTWGLEEQLCFITISMVDGHYGKAWLGWLSTTTTKEGGGTKDENIDW